MAEIREITLILNDYINNQSDEIKANDLSSKLTEAVQKTIKDPEFRTQLGNSEEFWSSTCSAFTLLHSNLIGTECLIGLLKLARNAVAGLPRNQQLAKEHGAIRSIETVLEKTDHHMVMQTGIQAMCNMITGDSVTLDDVWASWMTDEKQTIWSKFLSLDDGKIVMSTLVLIVNCISGSKDRSQSLVCTSNGRAILVAILGDMERLHGDEQSQNFELGYSIISQLISYGYFTEIFQMLQDQDDVNNRQTTLLKCLDSKVHAYSGDYPDFLGQKEYTQVTALLVDLGRKAVQVMQEVQQSGPDEKSTLDVEKVSQVYSCLVLALQLLSGLRAKDTGNEELKYILVRADTLTVVTDLLRYLETMDLTKGNTPKLGFDYLKRESVRFIGAVCYQDKDMQDKLRDIGGISLVLAQCKIDDANPYIREHAILALRNIVEHNEENQRLIRELQPISAVQTPELSEMGLRATLADGKVKLSKHEN